MRRLVSLCLFLLLAVPAIAQQPCSKVVSFGYMVLTPQGASVINYSIPGNTKGWINDWVKKNAKNYPDVCFLPDPLHDHANFLVVLSYSPTFFKWFQAKTVYTTGASWVSGSGTANDNSGQPGSFTYTAEVTMTTSVPPNLPTKSHTGVLYANAYNDDGALVSQQSHVYSTQKGGDGTRAFSLNLGNAFRPVNGRGNLITSSVEDIAGPAQKK